MRRHDLLRNAGFLAAGLSPLSFLKANSKPSKAQTTITKRTPSIAHIMDVHIKSLIGVAKGFEKCLHHIQN